MEKVTDKGRLPYLDSARGLAALSVITWHFLLAVYGLSISGFHFRTPFRFFWYGEANVIFFFIHSGFILSYSYTRHKWPFGLQSYGRYLVERIFRIYPLFLAILVFSFIAIHLTGPYKDISPDGWINRFWFSDINAKGLFNQSLLIIRIPESANLRLIPQDWTLTIELLAGAAIPLLAFSGKKHLLLFLMIMAVLKITNVLTTYVFEFGLGVLIFLFWNKIIHVWAKTDKVYKLLIAGLGILFYTGFFIFPSLYTNDITLLGSSVIGRLSVDIGCMIFFVLLLASGRLQEMLSGKVLVYIGKICYSVYLVHKLLILIFWRSFEDFFTRLHEQSPFIISSIYFSYMLLVILVSLLTYRLIEKPMNLVGKKISGYMGRSNVIIKPIQ